MFIIGQAEPEFGELHQAAVKVVLGIQVKSDLLEVNGDGTLFTLFLLFLVEGRNFFLLFLLFFLLLLATGQAVSTFLIAHRNADVTVLSNPGKTARLGGSLGLAILYEALFPLFLSLFTGEPGNFVFI